MPLLLPSCVHSPIKSWCSFFLRPPGVLPITPPSQSSPSLLLLCSSWCSSLLRPPRTLPITPLSHTSLPLSSYVHLGATSSFHPREYCLSHLTLPILPFSSPPMFILVFLPPSAPGSAASGVVMESGDWDQVRWPRLISSGSSF